MKMHLLSRPQFKNLALSLLGLLSGLMALGLLALNAPAATAAPLNISGNDFDPGRIIDDDVLVDYSTMSVDEIQSFLEDNVENGKCDRYHAYTLGSSVSGPFTCLFEYQENPDTGENNYGLFYDDDAPAEIEEGLTAAEIIWQAAQDYQINPQALLILLQKEQSLITDSAPWRLQFERATGYQCPDNAPCSKTSASFYKQVTQAAWQFRKYLNHTDDYWYIIGDNLIPLNPKSSCGHQIVNIQNKATIALYLYTPYVPNEAALNNLFGQGDSCSAYGNRNFWSYFYRWFGSPTSGLPLPEAEERVAPISWSFEAFYQGVFEDEDQSVALFSNSNEVDPGQALYIVIDFENTGSGTWIKNEEDSRVSLVARDQAYWLCHDSWLDQCEQVAYPEQERVESGQVASFEFWILAPETNGQFTASFSPFNFDNPLEGQAASLVFEVVGADKDTDFSQQPPSAPPVLESGDENPDETQDSEEDSSQIADNSEDGEPEADTSSVAESDAVVVLPANWSELSSLEKLLLNPWGCHDTTQIRADNGRCLSGGYTIPDSSQIADNSEDGEPEADTSSVAESDAVVVLPANWSELSSLEKLLLNPWGCHDTTQIRADNGRCLSGGYTIPDSSQIADNSEDGEPEADTSSVAESDAVVVLPANWSELSSLEKLLLNPWGCHDTTQIRADNGRCLSGGYTIPDSSQIADNSEDGEPEADTSSVAESDAVVVLPANWSELSSLEKLLLNPWGCHDTTQIRADNGRCLSGGYTIPDSSQIADNSGI